MSLEGSCVSVCLSDSSLRIHLSLGDGCNGHSSSITTTESPTSTMRSGCSFRRMFGW